MRVTPTRLMCIPGIKPVKMPKRIPKERNKRISISIHKIEHNKA
jgi:hypothetical protein